MKIGLTFTSSGYIFQKCRLSHLQVLDLVSVIVEVKDYGSALDLILVNVMVQDEEFFKPGTKLSRKNKDIRVDVVLSWKQIELAQDWEIRYTLLDCIIKAVEITKQRLTRKDDDFNAEMLLADLNTVRNQLDREFE